MNQEKYEARKSLRDALVNCGYAPRRARVISKNADHMQHDGTWSVYAEIDGWAYGASPHGCQRWPIGTGNGTIADTAMIEAVA